MLDLDIGSYVTEISDIADIASKEYQIERSLDAQREEWHPVNMEFTEWGSTGTYIVSATSVDEIQKLLDDHVIKTQTMGGYPYAVQLQQRIQEWESFLSGVRDIINVWLKVQSVWLYLEPIFSSEDIVQKMP